MLLLDTEAHWRGVTFSYLICWLVLVMEWVRHTSLYCYRLLLHCLRLPPQHAPTCAHYSKICYIVFLYKKEKHSYDVLWKPLVASAVVWPLPDSHRLVRSHWIWQWPLYDTQTYIQSKHCNCLIKKICVYKNTTQQNNKVILQLFPQEYRLPFTVFYCSETTQVSWHEIDQNTHCALSSLSPSIIGLPL